jgi:hypothetical protein
MNPRQPTKTPRNLRRHETPSSLPPVLFSLPNLSDSTLASPVAPRPEPIATVSTRLPLGSPPNDPTHARRDERQKEKSASLLNAAIGFLALALMLIGAKLYSDRASESSRAAQRTSQINNAENPLSPPPQTDSSFHAIPERGIPERGIIANVGPQRASYQVPLIPQTNRSVSESDPSEPQADPSDKPTLEISEPLSYQTEGAQGQIQQAQFQAQALPEAPQPVTSLPVASLPVASLPVASLPVASMPNGPALGSALGPGAAPKTTSPPAAFTPSVPNTIPAASLNTRDMIRLRQGKPVELTNREPGSPSSVPLSGETYPPVRQKYEPLSLPQPQTLPTNNYKANSYNGDFLPSRPTSMEIPPPPTPYQPIGSEPTQ